MLVPHQQHVHARHLGQVVVRVFHARRVRIAGQAAVRNRDDDVGALGAHLRYVFLRRFAHAFRIDLPVQPALVPGQDARRSEADHPDFQRRAQRLAIRAGRADAAAQDAVRREQRLMRLRAVDIGQHHGEAGAGATRRVGRHAIDIEMAAGHLVQISQAIVEFVVADAGDVHADLVHGLVDGQRLAARHRLDQRLVIGQRRALQRVAVVDQQIVGILGARLADQRGRAFQADRGVGLQLVIIITEDVGVQVGGFQQRQRGLCPGRRIPACRQCGAADQQGGQGDKR